jgi:hypothetical protein
MAYVFHNQGDHKFAVVESGADFPRVDFSRQVKNPKGVKGMLGNNDRAFRLFFRLLMALAADRKPTGLNRDLDVMFRRPRQFGLNGYVFFRLRNCQRNCLIKLGFGRKPVSQIVPVRRSAGDKQFISTAGDRIVDLPFLSAKEPFPQWT